MEISESESSWNFFDLLEKTARDISKKDFTRYSKPAEYVEKLLVEFLGRLPDGNYDELLKEWWNR